MSDPAAVAAGKEVAVQGDRLGLQWGLRTATVKTVSATQNLVMATFDGDSVPVPMFSMCGTAIRGARVYVLSVPPQGNYVVGLLGQVPGTILAYGERTTDKVSTGAEVGVLRLDGVRILAGYRYTICTSVLGLAMATSGDTGQALLRIRTDGTAAGTGDTLLQQADVNANSPFVPRNSATFAEPYLAATDGTLSVLLSLGRSGGLGNITMLGAATRPIRLFIVQNGVGPSDTGVVI